MEELNLHGTKHADVEQKVIRFIESNWDSGEEVEVITGNSSKMRELVIQVLNEYALSYSVGRPFDYRRGYLVILME